MSTDTGQTLGQPVDGGADLTREHTEGAAAPQRRLGDRVAARYGGFALLVLLIVVFGAAMPDLFLRADNFQNMFSEQAVPGILAIGLVLPLVAGEFDFSGGAVLSASAVAMALLSGRAGIPWPLCLLILVVGAAGIGIVNGSLVAYLGFNSFVATLATAGIIGGVSLMASNGETLYQGIPAGLVRRGRGELVGIPLPVIYLLIVCAVVTFVLRCTAWGRLHEAVGKGRGAAELAGVRIRAHLMWAFIGSSVLASLAGALLVARLGSAPPGIGNSYILAAFAAVFLGSTMLRPGFFNAPGAVVAICLIAVAVNGLSLAGVSSFVGDVVTGVLLIVAVGVSQFEQLAGRVTRRT